MDQNQLRALADLLSAQGSGTRTPPRWGQPGTQVRHASGAGENTSDWLRDRGLPASMDAGDLHANPVGVAAVGRAAFGGSAWPSNRVDQGFRAIDERTVPSEPSGAQAAQPMSPDEYQRLLDLTNQLSQR